MPWDDAGWGVAYQESWIHPRDQLVLIEVRVFLPNLRGRITPSRPRGMKSRIVAEGQREC
jgi:hypothetical protein